MNFKNMGEAPGLLPFYGSDANGNERALGNFSLARQPSILSWTFDEIQNNVDGLPKDFGSMNMDEFLKNIWTVEEGQGMGGSVGGDVGIGGLSRMGSLQRQGSLSLPRTLSHRTVDEVYRDVFRESGGDGGFRGNNEELGLPQRQPTFGEITLEEFLVRAGVVREDPKPVVKVDHSEFYGELLPSSNIPLIIPSQYSTLPLNENGVRLSQRQLFPKQPTVAYGSTFNLANNSELVGDPVMNIGFVQSDDTREGGGTRIAGFGVGAVKISTSPPANSFSSDGFPKGNGDISSLLPISYVINGGRGKRCGAVEKVVERRQRRMIKNRESAARSRARKQAYTTELEAEVAKLKDENDELHKKQAEILKIQKNQILETMDQQRVGKRRCLRRTHTGPW
ncbi:hypothetical protein GIB67_016239 [Kingdonia uniflora]|uniref:BZIP domain-containing protein n=1 Tax=Kingdonia uniflora TaxID=39325 RepID=A0A7J7LTD9_9MAGN|nr:hypothetical protein GIB67_016239 [Kingdonia uniflora]